MSKKIMDWIDQNSEGLLEAATIVGVVATTGSAIFATKKTIEELNSLKEDTDWMKKVKIIGLNFLPTIILGGLTIGGIVGLKKGSDAKYAALLAAYKAKDAEFMKKLAEKDPTGIAKEIISTPKEEKNTKEATENQVKTVVVEVDRNEYEKPYVYIDKETGLQFTASQRAVDTAVNKINTMLAAGDIVSVVDFYEWLCVNEDDIPQIAHNMKLGVDNKYTNNMMVDGMRFTAFVVNVSAEIPEGTDNVRKVIHYDYDYIG